MDAHTYSPGTIWWVGTGLILLSQLFHTFDAGFLLILTIVVALADVATMLPPEHTVLERVGIMAATTVVVLCGCYLLILFFCLLLLAILHT